MSLVDTRFAKNLSGKDLALFSFGQLKVHGLNKLRYGSSPTTKGLC